MTDQERMDQLVAEAFAHGDLFHMGQKTIIFAGKRRAMIRVQSAIFTRHMGVELSRRSDAFLAPLVDESLRRRFGG